MIEKLVLNFIFGGLLFSTIYYTANIVEDQNTITNDFTLLFKVGGTSSPRMEVNLATCHLEVPSHPIDDVISLETNFHALPSTIEGTDEITLKYVGA